MKMQHTQTAAPSGSQQHCQHASCEKQAWPQQHRLNVWVGHTSILPHMYSGACVGRILYCAANSCRSIAEQSYQQQVPTGRSFTTVGYTLSTGKPANRPQLRCLLEWPQLCARHSCAGRTETPARQLTPPQLTCCRPLQTINTICSPPLSDNCLVT
jgi:hypothetical protein